MTERHSAGKDEAEEAAQRVADSVESWEYSAEPETVEQELDSGLEEAGVEVTAGERDKLVQQIKDDDASPDVEDARPRNDG
jgi:hypothetical protein